MASPQRSNQTRVHCLPLHIGSTRHEDRILGKSVPLVSWPIRSNRPCKTTYPRWSTHARKPDAIMSPMQRHETRSLAVNQRTGVTSALTALPGGFGVPTRLRPVRRLPSPLGRPVSLVVGGDGPPTYVGSGGGGACLSSSGPARDMATPCHATCRSRSRVASAVRMAGSGTGIRPLHQPSRIPAMSRARQIELYPDHQCSWSSSPRSP